MLGYSGASVLRAQGFTEWLQNAITPTFNSVRNQQTRQTDRVSKQDVDLKLERQLVSVMQAETVKLQNKISNLQQELALYQRVVKENNGIIEGLTLGDLVIESQEDGTYALAMDIMQISGDGRVRGSLLLEIVGEGGRKRGREPERLTLHLGEGPEEKALALDFTHYQSVRVNVSLPKGFTPRHVIAKATFTYGKKAQLSERYKWQMSSEIV